MFHIIKYKAEADMKYQKYPDSKIKKGYVSVAAENITISNPASSQNLLLIDKRNKNIVPINEITINKNRKLDKEQILYQIAYSDRLQTNSYWENLSILAPGCTYTQPN